MEKQMKVDISFYGTRCGTEELDYWGSMEQRLPFPYKQSGEK